MPAFLDSVPPGSALRLDITDAGGAFLGQTPLAFARAPEFCRRPSRLGELPAPAPVSATARARSRAHPAAPSVLLAGLLALFLGGALGIFRGSSSGSVPIRTK